MFEAWVDGSVRGNPGIGGVGVVVKKDGEIVSDVSKIIGNKVTSNEAEYRAVMEAIRVVTVLNKYAGTSEDVVIYTDSALVHGQLEKNWKINHDHLWILNDGIKNLMKLSDFAVQVKLISREDNAEANDLAQEVTEAYKKERLNGVQ